MSTTRTFTTSDHRDAVRPVVVPPDNEVPVGVPTAVLLARTDDIAVLLIGGLVYSIGVAFDLLITTRTAVDDLHEHVFGGRRGRGLHVGIEFADGRRTTLDGDGDGDVLLRSQGGGGGGRTVQQSWWLHPVPPSGPMTVVVLAPGLGVEEARIELDATPFAAAVADVQELWPWMPEDAEPGLVEPDPELPEGSWFRGPVIAPRASAGES